MHDIVFLFDVDNTLIDNDRVQADLDAYISFEHGAQARDRYWEIFEDLRSELGYADYLGALERYRLEELHDPRILRMSNWLVDYPFPDRLYPGALEAVKKVRSGRHRSSCPTAMPCSSRARCERSGLWQAFDGHVLIYIHKEEELDDVERFYPSKHYVMIDDKLRILAKMKEIWGDRVTTVFPRQGHYATDPKILADYPHGDIQIDHIGDLVRFELADFKRS